MLLQQQEEEEHQQRMAARRQQPAQQPGQPGQAPAAQAAPSEPPQTAGRGSRPAPGPSHVHQRCTHLSVGTVLLCRTPMSDNGWAMRG